MSQPARAPRPPVDDTDIKVRNRRMLLVGGVMAVLAFVVAAGYWYTHQPGKAAPPPTALAITSAQGVLVVGSDAAKHHVVITESFACGACASFERSVQTFLRADAAAGIAQIRYEIPQGSNAKYEAMLTGDPADALNLHDQLFAAGTASGAGTLEVTVDGKPLPQTDPLDLANALETALAGQ